MKKAILFDLDGLIVDSETLGIEVAMQVCGQLGIALTPLEQRAFIGVTDEKFYRELFVERGVSFDVKEIVQKHFAIYENLLAIDCKSFLGASSLPKVLKSLGYKLAVVSGSTRHQIDIVLQSLDITNCFDVIVSCDDIATSKPSPEGYLTAAKMLDIHPEDCVVLEDAESGIKAGKQAGMRVIGVMNAGMQSLAGSDIEVNNLRQIEDDLTVIDEELLRT